MQQLTDVMDLEITLEVEVKECNVGMFGIIIGDPYDCYWTKYEVDRPIAHVHWLNAIDTKFEYVPWKCSFMQYSSKDDTD